MASPLDASAEGPAGAAREATFLFADIAGFTALTEAHGDEEAAALVAEFCRAAKAELAPSGGTQSNRSGMRSSCASPSRGRPSSSACGSPMA